jgi:glycosyltransferase involved in cell wall biosynthesis
MAAVRILVCASEAPRPPLNGSRLVLHQLCERLAARHEITVVALRHPDQTGPPPDGVTLMEMDYPAPGFIRAWAMRVFALALNEPVEVRRLAAPFERKLPALVGSFDVAHVMLGSLAGIAPALDGLPAVIAPLDAWDRNVAAETAVARGPKVVWKRSQERAVRRWQARAYRPFARVVLVTEDDAREVAQLDPSLHTAAIPNGVDAAHFAPPEGVQRSGILFTGALDAPANERAALRLAERILPRVRAAVPGVELTLAGRSPGRRLRELPGVRVVADVPDLRPYLWGAAVYACPMDSGTGIKNKLLEAMAAQAPCVATPLACQGLTTSDLSVADSDEALASSIVELLRDPARAARIGAAGRAYVRDHHNWDVVATAYEALWEEVRR